MKLHIFNPEHDIALAFNRRHLTVPHAAQELRTNLGWIPALWADDGDLVLTDDTAFARKVASKMIEKIRGVRFVGREELKKCPVDAVEPWGWDITLRTELAEAGVEDAVLPTQMQIEEMRQLSNRRHTQGVLQSFCKEEDWLCGESHYINSLERLLQVIEQRRNVVVKAPWSSSGRGVRYITEGKLSPSALGFVSRVVKMQGGIMLEPYYNKVKDFGMEFVARIDGSVEYAGLSLFKTQNGAYTGNILATEEEKSELLQRFITSERIERLKLMVCQYFPGWINKAYIGPFGIDMMIVARSDAQGFMVHPCVEINLRRTMGHVAIAISPQDRLQPSKLMTIEHDVNYQLKVRRLEDY